ncbi:transposase [Clostridium sp. UBA2485]|uniref:transposase n=1 Tax=Clostridium sp. UBA2485 TaxID=1946352 RepID=UPI0025C13A82|nr:transposase [Clostridium sp. UBA2485]
MTTKFTRKFTEEKRVAIVKEALEYGSNALVAAKYDINPKLLSTWKGNYRRYQQTLKPKEPKEENIIVNYKKEYKKLVEENKQKDLEIAVLRDLLKKRK